MRIQRFVHHRQRQNSAEEAMRRSNSLVPSTRSPAIARACTLVAAISVAGALSACGLVGAMVDGFKYAKAVEADLEQATGVRPAVGFNWANGRLRSVTVSFPKLDEDKPLRELAAATRAAVTKEFKQNPDNIVLAFSLGATPGTAAQAEQPGSMN
ncbi:MAG TPA: hypothetical protein VE087_00585 [Xanthobacteraceae bacterium]|nr:hypothetical protein [Xanthobacteraceae bacterium]